MPQGDLVNAGGSFVATIKGRKGQALLALADRVERGEIKALSIKQPYPHHIFYDDKDVENRDWPTKGRGWVIVHAGKATDELAQSQMSLPRGGVVGMMKITDCVEQMDSRWFFGRYGFVIGEAFPLPLIPCKGALGFFRLDGDTNSAIAAALRARSSLHQAPGTQPDSGAGPSPAAKGGSAPCRCSRDRSAQEDS